MVFALNQSKHIGIGLKFFSVVCVRTMMTLECRSRTLIYVYYIYVRVDVGILRIEVLILEGTAPLNTGVIVSYPMLIALLMIDNNLVLLVKR